MSGYERDFEETLAAYAAGRRADGMAACERLLQRDDLPGNIRATTQRNQVHYARDLVDLAPSFWARRIAYAPPPGWAATNPTLAVDPAGRVVTGVRLVNYRLRKGEQLQLRGQVGSYALPARPLLDIDGPYSDDHPVIISRTLVGQLDPDGDDGPFIELDESTLDLRRAPRAIANGLEDCRLLQVGDRMTITASAADADPTTAIRIVVADLTEDGKVVGPHFLSGIPGRAQEKNWMPFALGDLLAHVYSLSPTVVVETLRGGSTMRLVAMTETDRRLDGVRGGSPGVRLDDGWLFVAHVSAEFAGAGRTYLHRFVKLDDDFAVVGLSEPFRFVHDGVEFAAGLVRRGDRLLLSFGVKDAEAWVGWLDLAEVLALLTPVSPARRRWPAPPSTARHASILRPAARALRTPGWDGVIQPHWRLLPHTDVGPMYGDVRDTQVAGSLAAWGTWAPFERAWLASRVRPGMTVLDVGSNICYFTRTLATMVGPGGRVLALEPFPEMAALTIANVALANPGNVEVITAALGDTEAVATVRLAEDGNRGSSRIFGDTGETLATTRVVRLDDIVAPGMRIDVMKIDTEGMDHRVVGGALATMRRWGTCALVEFYSQAITVLGDDPAEVLRQYAAWGFRVAMLPFEVERIESQLGQEIASWQAAGLAITGREDEFAAIARRLVIVELTLEPVAAGALPRRRHRPPSPLSGACIDSGHV